MKIKFFFGFILATTLTFLNCSEDNNSGFDSTTGKLTVQLTDAPFPFDMVAEANVTVFKVEARKVDDDMDENAEDDSSEDDMGSDGNSPFIVLMEEEMDVNLLKLTNGVTEQLANLDVPVGTYDLIRIYVKGVNVVLADGRTFDLTVPSGQQTGIKVFIKPGITVAGGLSADLLLDFDVSRSFVPKGNIKTVDGIHGFNFKPVIKVSNLSTAGSLTGNVNSLEDEIQMALEGVQISVLAADTLNTSGFSDADGNYTIMGLEAGTYKVFAELEGYVKNDTLEVQITAANKTVQDFQLEKEVVE
ncbi:DUF4382 domain-containing protein [Flagellimonas pacifica]|uniref:Carboxypeptidase regulatory-like domain-containing protein n=1 Tax=Flagellimonas pacifica TaxID=1247520 RepID=A0A285MTJ1_9FLAO|nr:DUF4382 domain-containing protein [Allomuricauda parva]SNZ00505.1 Carboxypeptidase regulatory-like domain-containing protein [Allomuricauda parva]